MGYEHTPRKLDKVWNEFRAKSGRQANGYIHHIVEWGEDGSVMVKYHDSQGEEEFEEFSTAELDGKYHGEICGYMLHCDGRYVVRKN